MRMTKKASPKKAQSVPKDKDAQIRDLKLLLAEREREILELRAVLRRG